jgi:hypothetical protein
MDLFLQTFLNFCSLKSRSFAAKQSISKCTRRPVIVLYFGLWSCGYWMRWFMFPCRLIKRIVLIWSVNPTTGLIHSLVPFLLLSLLGMLMMIEFQYVSRIINTSNCNVVLKYDYKKHSYIDVCATLISAQVFILIFCEESSSLVCTGTCFVSFYLSFSSTSEFPRRII